ncbi:G2/mitotic-specific cyclin-B3-like [Chanos chanos]|uniref:G2/mitotic-specific cyclin-B3-like n=1 Tax=Chanos chanos TaxID=29144 RepID=A0A6J2WXX9_CHACN|nr:G2/mitotic-specific cyclin-B3-like [Chanos chanos]
MPVQRGRKNSAVCKLRGKAKGPANQEDDAHVVKRAPSSPQGAPKKRSAFVDLTNAKNAELGAQAKNETAVKKSQKSKVAIKSDAKLKDCSEVLSFEIPPKQVEAKVTEPLTEVKAHPSEVVEEEEPQLGSSPCHGDQQGRVPEEFDIDKEQAGDCCMTPEYAKDIFDYLKDREEKFILTDYMSNQPDLNKDMRGILVDWMVEVQENFELNHETLYLAVKLTDHYLSTTVAMRESLQLIGSASMLIAAKFEERCPPCLDDFLYICDDAYKRHEFIAMERNVLQGLNFDINIPIPYRFLRRYARVARANMETLTLARYVCELSLLELELVPERASRLASACLFLALVTKGLGGWTAILEYHSGYTSRDLGPLVRRLRSMLEQPADDKLRAVNSKYSHKVFFEVAKIPLVDAKTLEEALTGQENAK